LVHLAYDLDIEFVINTTQHFHHDTILNTLWGMHAH
jgi:hypothetical protein